MASMVSVNPLASGRPSFDGKAPAEESTFFAWHSSKLRAVLLLGVVGTVAFVGAFAGNNAAGSDSDAADGATAGLGAPDVTTLAGLGLGSPQRVCLFGETSIADSCVQRIVECSQIEAPAGAIVVAPGADTSCSAGSGSADPYDDNWFVTQWIAGDGTCYGGVFKSGECLGTTATGDFSCVGRCGVGCGGRGCSNWAVDCLVHDLCSYFHGASGGGSDPNCGDSFNRARGDFLTWCWWSRQCTASGPVRTNDICF